MKYAFVAAHRPRFPVRTMCHCLCIHPSGFYAWLKRPLSGSAGEDARQIALIKRSWEDSGKVYGYRKLHDDLRDQGERCSPNRVARLTKLAGIKAQIGYKRRPGRYGGKPAIIAENKVASEVPIPGCWGAYPAQQGYKFTSLCGDGTVITVTLSETGELASKAISAKLFDPEGDPLFTHAERSGEDLVFVSYGGSVYRISDKGEKAAVVDKFSFVDGAEGGWAPGGHELIAYNRAHNMLFVLMHSESYDGSHKDDAEEVWAIDLGQKRALYKSAAKGVSNIAATPGAAPKLFAMGEDDMLVIYEIDPEAKFAAKPVKETDVGTGGFIITE